jgi:hypothetical protein
MCVIVLITVRLSALFYINFRTITYEEIEKTLRANIARFQDRVSAKFREWRNMVHHTAINAAPFVAEEPIDTENLEILLMRTKNTQPDVSAIYCANNIPWSKGGYIYFLSPLHSACRLRSDSAVVVYSVKGASVDFSV